MNKVDIIKESKIDSGIVEDNLFEDWKIMRQTLEDEERKFKEVRNNKIDALAIYLYVMIPASFVCIVATQSIIYSLLCVFSLVIPFFIFFRWKRFYAYRSAFPTKSNISVNEVKDTLGYPKFLIASDFKFFSKRGFCRNAFYDERRKVLYLNVSNSSITEELSMVKDNDFSIHDLVYNWNNISESITDASLHSAVNKLLSSLDSIPADAFDTQFGRHLLRVYLEPLSKLLRSEKDVSVAEYKKILELLQILDSFLEEMKEVRQVSKNDSLSIDLDTMLRLAKIDRKVVSR